MKFLAIVATTTTTMGLLFSGQVSAFSQPSPDNNFPNLDKQDGVQQVWPGYTKPDPFNGGATVDSSIPDPSSSVQQVWPGYAKPDPYNSGATVDSGIPDPSSSLKQVWPGFAKPDRFYGSTKGAQKDKDKHSLKQHWPGSDDWEGLHHH